MSKLQIQYPPGATPLDPNELAGLIPTYITTQGDLNQLEKENILDTARWALGKTTHDCLNVTFCLDLHKRMFSKVWKWAGSTINRKHLEPPILTVTIANSQVKIYNPQMTDRKPKPPRTKFPAPGVTLEMMLTKLVENYGWERLGEKIDVRCFNIDPSIKSSLTFLRKTPWAREKVELLYIWREKNGWDPRDNLK